MSGKDCLSFGGSKVAPTGFCLQTYSPFRRLSSGQRDGEACLGRASRKKYFKMRGIMTVLMI